jgi:hypothetical protein
MPSIDEPVRKVMKIQTMTSDDEPVKHQVKQYKPWPAMMNH